MTDAKKITILERLLDERDEQIQELQKENAELQKIIDKYSVLDDDVNELRELMKEARQLNSELTDVKNEQLRLKKEYQKEMGMFLAKEKVKGNVKGERFNKGLKGIREFIFYMMGVRYCE